MAVDPQTKLVFCMGVGAVNPAGLPQDFTAPASMGLGWEWDRGLWEWDRIGTELRGTWTGVGQLLMGMEN